MSSKRTYIATFWRSNLQLENGGYYTTKEFQSVSLQGATKQAERYAASNMYGGMAVKSVELKQENSNMETTVFYVAVAYNGGFNPTVVEKFDNRRRQLCDSYVPRKATPVYCTRASNRMGRHSSRECMTLAAADRNGLGATPTAALSLILAFAILLRSN